MHWKALVRSGAVVLYHPTLFARPDGPESLWVGIGGVPTFNGTAKALNDRGVPIARGTSWYAATVKNIIAHEAAAQGGVLMNHIRAVPRLLQIAIFSAAFALPGWQAEAVTRNGIFKSLGAGTSSCGEWTDNRRSYDNTTNPGMALHMSDRSWVLDFISAYNEIGWTGVNVASETDAGGIFGWISNYCAANPTEDISTAVGALVRSLKRGPHPNDK